MPWRRKWQPTPGFLPGESQGWGSRWVAISGVAQSRTQLKRLSSSSSIKPEKAMAPHSSTLAWKIPWMEESGGLQSMGSRRVGHDWATSLSLFTFMHWRRKWQPTPLFLSGESQGWWSLVGCHLWGHTESDTTEVMQQQQQQHNAWHSPRYSSVLWTDQHSYRILLTCIWLS